MVLSKGLSEATLQIRERSQSLLSLGAPDVALKGGLGLGELHELASLAPFHCGASLGFALALATLVPCEGRVIWVQQDFAALETGALYGLGCDLFGLASSRLLVVRAATQRDTLWAMEEAVKTSGIAAVIGELAQDGQAADLTATRRLSLAAQQGGGLCLLLRQAAWSQPSAAATRWVIAAIPGAADGFGGLGRTAFRLSLTKNRRGPCGSWVLQWDHHAKRFLPALSVAVAAPPRHGSADAPIQAAG